MIWHHPSPLPQLMAGVSNGVCGSTSSSFSTRKQKSKSTNRKGRKEVESCWFGLRALQCEWGVPSWRMMDAVLIIFFPFPFDLFIFIFLFLPSLWGVRSSIHFNRWLWGVCRFQPNLVFIVYLFIYLLLYNIFICLFVCGGVSGCWWNGMGSVDKFTSCKYSWFPYCRNCFF